MQVGEVLEESARIALSWIRSHAGQILLSQPPSAQPEFAGMRDVFDTSMFVHAADSNGICRV